MAAWKPKNDVIVIPHDLPTSALRKRVERFFQNLITSGYAVQYEMVREREYGIFSAKYQNFFIGTINMTGTVVWNGQVIQVDVKADKFQDRVEARIREFVERAVAQ